MHVMYSAHIHLLLSLTLFSSLPSHIYNVLIPSTKIVYMRQTVRTQCLSPRIGILCAFPHEAVPVLSLLDLL